MMRASLQHWALRAGLFDALRSAYHVVGNRPYYHLLKRRQALFAPFVRSGDLVFDVGANHGEFALVYRRLGARVLCVEPNPTLAAKLRARYGSDAVVEVAVSDQPGRATLHLGSDSNYSTIVPAWLPITKERDRLSDQSVDVDVTTLDRLIARHGVPTFLKIDVEANELPVLLGLSQPIRALMFEYQCPLIDQVAPALDHLQALGPYRFGLLEQDRIVWGDRDDLLRRVTAVCATGAQSGDVYARLP
jgi:FkbM family methyltransferase